MHVLVRHNKIPDDKGSYPLRQSKTRKRAAIKKPAEGAAGKTTSKSGEREKLRLTI